VSGDLKVKIKDIINEAFGTRGVRDPYSYDYEKDPTTGEYTGRQETNPRSFTNMISGVADRVGAGSGSMWVKAPDDNQKERVNYYTVPEGRVLVVQDKNGRTYYKNAAKPGARNPTGVWTTEDEKGIEKEIFQPETVAALERLAQQVGKLTFATNKIDQDGDQAAEPTAAEPTAAEPTAAEPTDAAPEEPMDGPSIEAPLHPDVSVLQSYPLVMQYKGKRFEMDDYGAFHPFGTRGKVTDALQTFLTKERMKL
jgi:hypothetical protein